MAANNAQATGTVYLDTSSAQFALDKLNQKIQQYDSELAKTNLTQGKRITLETNRAEAAKKAIEVETQLAKGLGATYNQQKDLVKSLARELKVLPEGTQQHTNKLKELQKANGVFRQMTRDMNGVEDAQKKIIAGSSGLTRIGAFFANLAANLATNVISSLANMVRAAFDLRVQLDKSVANLSAITGATGEDLAFLKEQAIALSKTSSESAVDFVEAFKLIASAKPELLSAKEDLVEVTKAALLLSQASGISLPDAATRLTDALNQFGEPAAAATRYVDALAAASKFGAAEVPQVTEALLQFGAQAKSSNINIFESAAAIELLAEKGIKGAEAGTKLRNVFLALNAVDALDKKAIDALAAAGVNTDRLKDKTLSLEERLKELSKVQGNATALVQIFGKENFNAAQIILQNIPRYAELTSQIKQQGIASKQAAANTDTLDSSWQRFKNTFSALFLEGSNSPAKKAIDALTVVVTGFGLAIDGVNTRLRFLQEQVRTAYAIAKDLVTLNFKGAGENLVKLATSKRGLTDEEKKAYQVEVDNIGKNLVSGTDNKSIEEKKKFLLLLNNKISSLESQLEAAQILKDKDLVNRLTKTIEGYKQASKSLTAATTEAAKPPADNTQNKQLTPEQIEAQKKAAEKINQATKKAVEEFNRLIQKMNEDLNNLLTPEASKAFIAILKEATSETQQLNAIRKQGVISELDYQKALALIEEKKVVALRELVKLQEKSYQKPINNSTTFDDGKTAPQVPVQLIPVVDPADLIGDDGIVKQVGEILARNQKAGIALSLLRGNAITRRNILIKELEEQKKLELANTQLTENEKELIRERFRRKKKEIEKDTEEEIAQGLLDALDFVQQALSVLDTFYQAKAAKENRELNNEIKANDVKRAQYKRQLDAKLISQQEFNRRVAILDREENAKKEALAKQQFERTKRLQAAQTIISGIAGGIRLWIDPGFPAAIPLAILLAAQTAASVALIQAQKYAGGGQVQRLKNGKITAAPNVPTQSGGDNVLALVKPGEVILNEDQQRRAGGAGFFSSLGVPGFAGGGSVQPFWKARPYTSLNVSEIVRSIKVVQYAQGGMVPNQNPTTTTDNSAAQANQMLMNVLGHINQSLNQMQATLENPVAPTVDISIHKITDILKAQERIKKNAGG